MQNEKCKSCFECAETVIVKVRDDRKSEWRDSSVRRCANDQCWYIVDGTREDRLTWIGNVYDYKYFGDYELSPEQLAAVYEAKRLAALSTDAEPVGYIHDFRATLQSNWARDFSFPPLVDNDYIRNIKPVYAAPPAPSVGVKALEWEDNTNFSIARTPFGDYTVHWDGSWTGIVPDTRSLLDGGIRKCADVPSAKAACQSDLQARYAALSAQVQDVAGVEDKIEGLKADLDSAIEVAFKHGATDWVLLNYPIRYVRLTAAPAAKQGEAE